MSNRFNFLLIFTTLFSVCQAVPAKKGVHTMIQPDGSPVDVCIHGDEHFAYYTTSDGYLLATRGDMFYFAGSVGRDGMPVSSGLRAADADRRTVADNSLLQRVGCLRPDPEAVSSVRRATDVNGIGRWGNGMSFPVTGDQKGLVILVEFNDQKFQTPDANAYFSRMLNEPGFSDNGATGSARDYFIECSGGVFRPTFDVYGPVTLPHSVSYYGEDITMRDDNCHLMFVDACAMLDDQIDFRQYDRDKDGFIDNVFIYFAGLGQNMGGAPTSIWPKNWNMSSATSSIHKYDGVTLECFSCSNEWHGDGPEGIGTFCHEFTHVLGLPDLYRTNSSSSFTPGAWSVLDYGPYNNNGRTPPLYSAYERNALGWMQPVELDHPDDISLRPIGTNEACCVRTDNPKEIYLIENRQQTGWDAYVPGHGLLVWHVDFVESIWRNNAINNKPEHQYVDIVEADGLQDDRNRDGDTFPGAAGVTSITDDTSPSMRSWSGAALDTPLTDITENADGTVSFKVKGGAPVIAPVVAAEATAVTPAGFTASWTPSDYADLRHYEITVYFLADRDGMPSKVYAPGYNGRDVGTQTSCEVTGLNCSTRYYYSVKAVGPYSKSPESNVVEVSTLEPTFGYMAPGAGQATDVTDNGFTATWGAVEGAVSYLVTVYTKLPADMNTDVVDFTGGISKIPAGWSTGCTMTYSMKSFVGEAAPSLRMAKDGDVISSPVYGGDVHSLSFWCRGNLADEVNSCLKVEAVGNVGRTELEPVVITNAAGGEKVRYTRMPVHTTSVRITYVSPDGKGSVALDDIRVEWGGDMEAVPVPGLESVDAGDALSLPVAGLQKGCTYYYTVMAVDAGGTRSLPSDEVEVTVGYPAGVIDSTVGAGYTVNGRVINFSSAQAEVYDCYGRRVHVAAGAGSAVCLHPGLYIVRTSGDTAKILIH